MALRASVRFKVISTAHSDFDKVLAPVKSTSLNGEAMSEESIGRGNVGRIAERIVANELEFRGFRVSDLNKDGVSANADLLAVKAGKAWQIQVKGASYEPQFPEGWWFNYGYCNKETIDDRSAKLFNRAKSFYWAQIVVLVCVRSPKEYCCAVLPVDVAEQAVQINLDYAFRTLKKDGSPKKPGKMWVTQKYLPTRIHPEKRREMERELQLIAPYFNKWDIESVTNGRPLD